MTPAPTRRADLVLEGGGVKGVALVGAATALDEAGWRFERIAGSSAGALVGAVIAAMQQAGESMAHVDDIMRTLDYRKMLDRRPGGRALSWWPLLANGWGIARHLGMYRGHYMTQWVRGVLGEFGVRTFADLAFDDPGSALGQGQSFRLVVTASDLSRQRLMYLPWDLESYGVETASYPVSRAIRASSAIPFTFEPVDLFSKYGKSTLADGSLLRSYPIEIFDRHDGKASRWPTIGIRLSSPASERNPAKPVTGPISLMQNLIYTMVDSTQVRHVADPIDVDRSIFAKPRGVRWTDFDLTPEQQESLFAAGYAAGRKWVKRFPEGPALNTTGTSADPGQIDVT